MFDNMAWWLRYELGNIEHFIWDPKIWAPPLAADTKQLLTI